MSGELTPREMKHACCLCRYLDWWKVEARVFDWRDPSRVLAKPVIVGVCTRLDEPFIPTNQCGEWESRLEARGDSHG